MTPRVVLFSRPGCGLCATAREVLDTERARTAFDLEELDVSTDEALERAYGIRIPVVLVDGREIAEIALDPEVLRAALGLRPR